MFGVFAFLSSVAFVPHLVVLLGGVYVVGRNPKQLLVEAQRVFTPPFRLRFNEFLVVLIILFSLLSTLIVSNGISSFRELIPYILFFPIVYVISNNLKLKDWNWFVYFVALEALVGLLQFVLHANSFFPSLVIDGLGDSNLLYYRRVFGLSQQSSVLAGKVFVSIVLLPYLPIQKVLKRLIFFALLTGLLVTFNRTVIMVVVLLELVRYLQISLKGSYTLSNFLKHGAIMSFGVLAFGILLLLFGEEVVMQLTRNKNTIEITGRDYIWAEFFQFIKGHLFFGNGGAKLLTAKGMHAHNSYIQLLANQGVFVFGLVTTLIVRGLKRNNLLPIAAILLYSTFQYGIFWGVSIMDILFWFLLFQLPKLKTSIRL